MYIWMQERRQADAGIYQRTQSYLYYKCFFPREAPLRERISCHSDRRRIKGSTEAIVGAEAVLNIQKYHFSKGFFGTNGIDQKMAFTTPDINEALVKQVAMRNTQAENRYVLTTSDKFDKIYAVTFSGFEGSVILTEKMPGESFWKNVNIQCGNYSGPHLQIAFL